MCVRKILRTRKGGEKATSLLGPLKFLRQNIVIISCVNRDARMANRLGGSSKILVWDEREMYAGETCKALMKDKAEEPTT
jgi:hypothetical protein